MSDNRAFSEHGLESAAVGVCCDVEDVSALHVLLEMNRDGLLVQDTRGDDILLLNSAMTALTGYDEADAGVDSAFIFRLFPDAEARAQYDAAFAEALACGRSEPVRTMLRTKSERVRHVWMTLAQVEVYNQRAILASFREETPVPAQASDSQNAMWVNTLIQTVGEGITLSNWEGHFRVFNKTMEEITGYTHEEANQAEDFLTLLYPDAEDYQHVHQMLRWVSRTGRARELKTTITTKAGQSRVLLVSTSVLRDEDQLWFLSAYRDITAHQRVLEALRVSERKYKSMTEHIPLGIYRATPDGRLLHGNPALARILGYASITEMMDGCSLPAMYLTDDQRQAHRRMLAEKDGLVSQEVQLRTYDGRTIWVRDSGRAALDDEGVIQYIDGTLEDITERKKTQQALKAFAEEVHARNQELDTFSRTVAHDLKNPLNLITGYAELLVDEWHDLPEDMIGNSLQTMRHAAYKMASIIEELLLLAGVRQQEVIACPIDMDQVIDEVRDRMRAMVEQHGVELVLPDRWPVAWGHGPWIEEVWVNYMSNAIKYGGDPPRVELGYGTEALDSVAPNTERVCFWVRDNGAGLTEQEQAQLFAPFKRLDRNQVAGHGLGLSIVRRIVEKLGGEVGVESQVGEGSLFYFTLPQRTLDP